MPGVSSVMKARAAAYEFLRSARIDPAAPYGATIEGLRERLKVERSRMGAREWRYFRRELSNQIAQSRELRAASAVHGSSAARIRPSLALLEGGRRMPRTSMIEPMLSESEKVILRELASGRRLSEIDAGHVTDRVLGVASELYPLDTVRWVLERAPGRMTQAFARSLGSRMVMGVNAVDAEQFDAAAVSRELPDRKTRKAFEGGLRAAQRRAGMSLARTRARYARRPLGTVGLERAREERARMEAARSAAGSSRAPSVHAPRRPLRELGPDTPSAAPLFGEAPIPWQPRARAEGRLRGSVGAFVGDFALRRGRMLSGMGLWYAQTRPGGPPRGKIMGDPIKDEFKRGASADCSGVAQSTVLKTMCAANAYSRQLTGRDLFPPEAIAGLQSGLAFRECSAAEICARIKGMADGGKYRRKIHDARPGSRVLTWPQLMDPDNLPGDCYVMFSRKPISHTFIFARDPETRRMMYYEATGSASNPDPSKNGIRMGYARDYMRAHGSHVEGVNLMDIADREVLAMCDARTGAAASAETAACPAGGKLFGSALAGPAGLPEPGNGAAPAMG